MTEMLIDVNVPLCVIGYRIGMRNRIQDKPEEVELLFLKILADKKARDRTADAREDCDNGMTSADIARASYKILSTTIPEIVRRKALASLAGKGEIVRSAGVGMRQPYRITTLGENRLSEFLEKQHDPNPISSYAAAEQAPVAEPRPDDDDPKAMSWVARKYAAAMFPSDPNKKGRG